VSGNLNRAMNATDPRFKTWLFRETGIDAHSLGINALERAVLERVRATRAASPAAGLLDGAVDAYWQQLSDSPDERLATAKPLSHWRGSPIKSWRVIRRGCCAC
jgi:chemotaxis protein methyltransferase WspC